MAGRRVRNVGVLHALLLGPPCAFGAEPPAASTDPVTLDRITVVGRQQNLLGVATTASEGSLDRQELERRPRLRPGDMAEFIPGVAATQHSGSGKANQYFLRGFNLDHGTDFAQYLEDMPINLRSHGHGQGYSDLNFIIPELVDALSYRKGPYYVDVGDFSSAGSARYVLADGMPRGLLQLEAGQGGYRRVVAADSGTFGRVTVTGALEVQGYDGQWDDIDEDVDKKNAMLRVSAPLGNGQAHALLMAYDNRWNSPDQIPARAVAEGLITERGSIDTTLGGDSRRHSLSAGWQGRWLGGETRVSAYWIDYGLSLWSNFTYFLDDPDSGDQFRQFDNRTVTGFRADQQWEGDRWTLQAGLEGRRDDIGAVGLARTVERRMLDYIRNDRVDERSLGGWLGGSYRLTDTLRINGGLRRDHYDFEVDALQPENSGDANDSITSAKAGLAWRVAEPVELYASWGQGFHSNDARGTTLRLDPVSGEAADPVTPLVRSRGSELGVRWFQAERFQTTLALWQLELDSELLFVGDAGNTEATRPSKRKGAELTAYWFAQRQWNLELEAAYTDARFSDHDPAGDAIPGAVPWVVSAGWNAEWGDGWHSSLRVRYLGAYPLIEDVSVESDGATIANLAVGKRWKNWGVELDVLNLFDSNDHDIDYYYASRLPGEPDEGVEDLHFHVFEPRTIRVRLTYRF
nr:TonB-dependent receptor [Stenotrophomonas bentonitica]